MYMYVNDTLRIPVLHDFIVLQSLKYNNSPTNVVLEWRNYEFTYIFAGSWKLKKKKTWKRILATRMK